MPLLIGYTSFSPSVKNCLQSGPLFSRTIVEIERFAFLAAILDECQNDLTEK